MDGARRKRIRSKVNYANVMSTIAVFVALGGSAYAGVKITGKNVVDGSLTGKDIRDNSVKSKDVDRNFVASLRGSKGDPGEPATKLWAVVHSTGLLARGKGATGVRTLSGGSYEVVFNQAVTDCAYLANVGDVEPRNPTAGYAVVSQSPTDPNVVHVRTKQGSSTENADRDFYVAVLC